MKQDTIQNNFAKIIFGTVIILGATFFAIISLEQGANASIGGGKDMLLTRASASIMNPGDFDKRLTPHLVPDSDPWHEVSDDMYDQLSTLDESAL